MFPQKTVILCFWLSDPLMFQRTLRRLEKDGFMGNDNITTQPKLVVRLTSRLGHFGPILTYIISTVNDLISYFINKYRTQFTSIFLVAEPSINGLEHFHPLRWLVWTFEH